MDGRRASVSFLAVLVLVLSLVVAAAPKVLSPAGEGNQNPQLVSSLIFCFVYMDFLAGFSSRRRKRKQIPDVASEIQFLYSPEFLLHLAVARFAAEALVEIRAALHDTGDVLSDWKASSGGDGPCGWMLVTCYDGHVSGLELAHRNLTGTLSPAIGKLRRLRFLFLQHNAISGPIPGTVARLHQLRRLDLSYNQLTGAIPSALGDLRDIFFVRLSNNNLSGSIPDSLATSRSIFFLDLSFNNLSGTVPVFNARNVFLEGNNFSCDKRCSSVTPDPDVIPTGDPDAHEKRLERTARTVALYIATSLVIAFFIAGIVVAVWQWRRRHQIFADIDGNNISSAAYVFRIFFIIHPEWSSRIMPHFFDEYKKGIMENGYLSSISVIVMEKYIKDCVSAGGEDQFHTEVEVISLIVHPNLLHLTGFCATDNERLLVYPYMPNGTVSSKLQGFQLNLFHVSKGWCFSCCSSSSEGFEDISKAKERLEEKRLDLFVDSRLRNEYDIAELEEMVQIALLCTMYSPDDRPSMAEIVRMLQGRDGSVAEKWEAVKFVARSKHNTPEFMLPSPVNFPYEEYNSIQLEADELSGPR
ncbi:hypothetical protein ABZP36_013479 [Zizania latifolia]